MTYESIEDWSVEGRAALVAAQGLEIRHLLDLAFTELVDEPGTSLRDFGFGGDDPVSEAVEWCVQRFASGELDPQRIREGSRSFRLFTEVSFWLAQRVGAANVSKILRRRQQRSEPHVSDAEPGDLPAASDVLTRLQLRLGQGLQRLRTSTCADLIEYWLIGTERIRREWFGDERSGQSLPERTPKQRSQHIADALFRYAVLLLEGVERAGPVCAASLFEPCENAPPYRVSDEVVRRRLGLSRPAVAAGRRGGVKVLVQWLVCVARGEPSGDPDEALEEQIARHSLRRTLLHLYGLEADPELTGLKDTHEPA